MRKGSAAGRGPVAGRGPRSGSQARLVGAGILAVGLAAGLGGPLGVGLGGPRVGSIATVDVDELVRCTFDVSRLGEVSGIALSRRHPDVVWVTNDSSGGPYLYAVDTGDCRIRATLRLLDTPARDHEALAVGQDARGRDVIWVGDIGDNLGTWPYARIHKVVEPRRLRDADVPVTTYRFTYPDGPVDAEGMMAAPDREQLWVVTKEAGVGAVFALPSPMSDAQAPMVAERVGAARSQITDAAMSPDGARHVLRDYLSAEVFAGEPPGEPQARFRLPLQPQGEAITWTADGRSLLVASEMSGDLIEVAVPGTALGTDAGIAAALPRVAGFDIYPYVRVVALGLGGLAALAVLRRRRRERRRQRARG